MRVNIKVPGLEKLLDYLASGIGSVAGPLLASWQARREAEARLIAATGEAEAQRVLAESQATTMHIIANAQADARKILVSPESNVQGELDLAQTVTHRIQFQEQKRQSNIGVVAEKAALEIADRQVEDHEPDHDWTARFFSDVQDVSSEEMQSLWAKVLAREVERPGGTSMQTLSILKNLEQETAGIFSKLCSTCVSMVREGNDIVDVRVPSLGASAGNNALKQYGLDFVNLNVLAEHGLIISDYNSWRDYRRCIASRPVKTLRIPFTHQNRYWVLVPASQDRPDHEFRLSGVALTRAGYELSRFVELESMNEFTQDLMRFFETLQLRMTEVDDGWYQFV